MLKVVIDTNVLINGVQDDFSFTNRIINAVIEGHIEALSSSHIHRENTRMALRLITDDEYLDKLEDFHEMTRIINPTKRHRLSVDRDDDKFIDVAVAGDAHFIISDDSDLLDIGAVNNIRMVKPEEFWNIYTNGETEDDESNEWNTWTEILGLH